MNNVFESMFRLLGMERVLLLKVNVSVEESPNVVLPLTVRLPPILAYPPTSKLVVTDALPVTWRAKPVALNVFNAVQVFVCDLEGTPSSPQSRVIFASDEPDAVMLKELPSKDRDAMLVSLTPPKVSLTSRFGALVSVSVSVPQENCPAFQTSLPVVGLQV